MDKARFCWKAGRIRDIGELLNQLQKNKSKESVSKYLFHPITTITHATIKIFQPWAFLSLPFIALVPVFLYWMFSNVLTDPEPSVLVVCGVMLVFCLLVLAWFVFGELRTKALSVRFEGDVAYVKGYLGLGSLKEVNLKMLDGFVISLVPSKYDEYEFLYLLQGSRKVVKLSVFYHRNYEEMKAYLATRLPFLGERPFSLGEEMKEMIG